MLGRSRCTSRSRHPAVAIECLNVLVQHRLITARITLLGDENRPSQKEVPDPKPALAMGSHDRFSVSEPVLTPGTQRSCVVATYVCYAVHFEPGLLEGLEHRRRR